MKNRIFILDDEDVWHDFITSSLQDIEDIEMEHFHDCGSLRARLRRDEADLLILDWNLPDGSGLSMTRILREQFNSKVPIIILTSRESEEDIVAALQMGADDFVSKPVPEAILRARVKALLRRTDSSWSNSQQIETIAGLRFDTQQQMVFREQDHGADQEEEIALSTKEFELALLLFRSLGTPVAREAIYAKVWNSEVSVQSRTLDTHITQVRRKLNLRPEDGFQLSTVYGYGYRLEKLRE